MYDVIVGTLTMFGYEEENKENKIEQTINEQERR